MFIEKYQVAAQFQVRMWIEQQTDSAKGYTPKRCAIGRVGREICSPTRTIAGKVVLYTQDATLRTGLSVVYQLRKITTTNNRMGGISKAAKMAASLSLRRA